MLLKGLTNQEVRRRRWAKARWFSGIVLQHPRLWSLNLPSFTSSSTTILQEGRAVDFTTTTFGIRTIPFDADKGFFLNGQHVEIYGTANHQDFAGCGDCGARQPASLAGQRS